MLTILFVMGQGISIQFIITCILCNIIAYPEALKDYLACPVLKINANGLHVDKPRGSCREGLTCLSLLIALYCQLNYWYGHIAQQEIQWNSRVLH